MVVVFLAFWSLQGHGFTWCLGGNGLDLVSTSPSRHNFSLSGSPDASVRSVPRSHNLRSTVYGTASGSHATMTAIVVHGGAAYTARTSHTTRSQLQAQGSAVRDDFVENAEHRSMPRAGRRLTLTAEHAEPRLERAARALYPVLHLHTGGVQGLGGLARGDG
jgi:hypothetical protein